MRKWIWESHALLVHILLMNIHDWSIDTAYKSTAHITSYLSKFILSTLLIKWKKIYHTVGTIPKSIFLTHKFNKNNNCLRYSDSVFEQYLLKFAKMWYNHVPLMGVYHKRGFEISMYINSAWVVVIKSAWVVFLHVFTCSYLYCHYKVLIWRV